MTVKHRRGAFRASPVMPDRVFSSPTMDVLWNTVVDDIAGEDKVSGLALRATVTGGPSILDVTGEFVAIGHDPRSELVKGQVDLDDGGYVLVGTSTRTSLAGVFATGDLVDHSYRQAVTAVGDRLRRGAGRATSRGCQRGSVSVKGQGS